jgi:hypothetical protein
LGRTEVEALSALSSFFRNRTIVGLRPHRENLRDAEISTMEVVMMEKFVCDWDHRDEAKYLVREGQRWRFSCEKHVVNFSPSYVVPISQSALMRDATKAAVSIAKSLCDGRILRITNPRAPYDEWEFYAAVVKGSSEPKVCDIGYSPKFAKFLSPLYLTLERYEGSIVRLLINGWQIEILEGRVSNEADLRRFVKNFHQKEVMNDEV